jgi:5-methylcytosine-specific restriction endonuclease McrA
MPNKARKTGLISGCTRKRLIKLRGHKCEICGYTGMLVVHHVIPVQFGGTNADSNYQLLCEKCHADAHGVIKRHYLDKEREAWNG